MNDNDPFTSTKWVDAAKGIGILSVIAGNIFTSYTPSLIYLYHMPLFFFIGGFLYSNENNQSYFIDKAKKLLRPYLFYMCLFFILATGSLYFNNELTPEVLLRIIRRDIYGGELLSGWLGVFWFITVFFISQQLLNILLSRYSLDSLNYIVLFILIMAYYIGSKIQTPLPLNCGVALYAMPIMYIGYLAKIHAIKFNIFVTVAITIALVIFALRFPYALQFNMKTSDYGIPFVNLIISIAIIYFIALLTHTYFSENAFLNYCGKHALTILLTHQFIHLALANKLFNSQILIFALTLSVTLLWCYLSRYATYVVKSLPIRLLGNR